jgi:hypothetical protein
MKGAKAMKSKRGKSANQARKKGKTVSKLKKFQIVSSGVAASSRTTVQAQRLCPQD